MLRVVGAIPTSPLPGLCSALELPHTSREQLCDSPWLQLPINFLESSLISLIMPPWPSSASFPAEVFACESCLSPLTSSCPSVFQVSPFLGACPLSSCSFLLFPSFRCQPVPPEQQEVFSAFAPLLSSFLRPQAEQIRTLADRELLGWAVRRCLERPGSCGELG